jgi:transcriptional regulator with XRE-family HTH domain
MGKMDSNSYGQRTIHGGKKSAIGQRLSELRRENDWTLQNVADMTGVSVATLSKVERDKLSLTYDKMLQLAEGLKMTLAELIAPAQEAQPTARRSIARRKDGLILRTPNYEYNYLCVDLSNKRMIPILTRIKAHTVEEFGPLLSHSGEEFIYVLEGEIKVHTEHYEPVRLRAGESIYIDSTMGHAYVKVGENDALVLGVCSSEDPHHSEALRAMFGDQKQRTETKRANGKGG